MALEVSEIEYRSVIRFFVLKGTAVKDSFNELNAVYGESAPSHTIVKYWAREFKGGTVSVVDEAREGRPIEISIDEDLIEEVQSDRRITVRELSTEFNCSVGTISERLKALGIRKLCSRFVPRFLSAEMMERRKAWSLLNISIFELHDERFTVEYNHGR